jgi:hypothetical protein
LTKLGARKLVTDVPGVVPPNGPRYSPDGKSIAAVGPGAKSLAILTTRGRFVRSIRSTASQACRAGSRWGDDMTRLAVLALICLVIAVPAADDRSRPHGLIVFVSNRAPGPAQDGDL